MEPGIGQEPDAQGQSRNGQDATVELGSGRGHAPPRGFKAGRLIRLAWLPIPLLTAAIIAGRVAGLRGSYENETLRLVLSFGFYTLASLGTLFLIGRSFLRSGSPGLLLLECGVVLWSLAGTVGDLAAHGDANINVTIFNTGMLLAGVCHLAGAVLSLRPGRALRLRGVWLGLGCAVALAALGLITRVTLGGGLPLFFIPGQGGTTVRYWVLISATAMFVLAAVLLLAGRREQRAPFALWYSLALLLLAVGLFGIMIQLSLWSAVNWLARTAQWLGGLYLLLAAVAAVRESELPLLAPPERTAPRWYRYGVAIAVVLAAAALRLAFLQALGMRAPFLMFYPAVMLVALYGGQRAGWLATALSGALANYFWIEPRGQLAISDPADWLSLGIFLLSGWMISWVSEAMHQARARALAAEAEVSIAAERQRAAEALRESEGRLKHAQQIANLGSWEWDFATDTLHWSEQTYRQMGLDPGSFVPTHEDFWKRVHPDDLAAFNRAIERALAQKSLYECEFRIVRPNGEVRILSSRGEVGLGEGGEPVRMVGVCVDVTERKQAEEKVRESEERLRLLVDGTKDYALLMLDPQGHVTTWNEGARRLKGYESEEVIGRHFSLFYAPEDVAAGKPTQELEVAEREGKCEEEGERMRKDGSRFWASVHISPLRDEQGRLRGFSKVTRDITERKRAEEALRASETRFGSIVSSAMDAIISVDADQRIVLFNAAAERMFGHRAHEAVGQSLSMLLPADRRAVHEQHVRGFAATGVTARQMGALGELVGLRANGEQFPLEASISQIEVAGGKVLTVILRDITERKRAEAALRESEEQFRGLADSIPNLAWWANEDGYITW